MLAIDTSQDSDTFDSGEQVEDASDASLDESNEATPSEPSDESSNPVDDNDEEQSDASSPEETEDPVDDGPLDGFGEISGDCGILDLMMRQQAAPFIIENAIDFSDDPYDELDLAELTDGGREIISDGNAGGSSLLSEVFAYEVWPDERSAVLLKTETEIIYNDPAGKKTDLLVMIGESKLGVSVTRAWGFPEDPYTLEQAQGLLEQKLSGVVSSSANVSDEDAWSKQILHIVTYADEHALSLQAAYELLSDDFRSNTVVWVTVSHGDDEFLY